MIYTKECELKNFEAWSGGKDTIEELDESELDTIEACLADVWIEKPPTETDINDFLWFERDTIAEWLGFADWESLESYHREAE